MANSTDLSRNSIQHKAKNTRSKLQDKDINIAMKECIGYLKSRFPATLEHYRYEYAKDISFEEFIKISKNSGIRSEYDSTFNNRKIIPDGGIIFLIRKDDTLTKKYY